MFEAVPKHPEKTENWMPISPEEPFAYLSRLENAVLERRDGQTGIVFKEEIPQGNGQNL